MARSQSSRARSWHRPLARSPTLSWSLHTSFPLTEWPPRRSALWSFSSIASTRRSRTAAAIRTEIERRVKEEVARHADVEEVERKIEGVPLRGSQGSGSGGNTASGPVIEAEERGARPMIIPPGIDPKRGWFK